MNMIAMDQDKIPPGFSMPDQANGPEGRQLNLLLEESFNRVLDYPPVVFAMGPNFQLNWQVNKVLEKASVINLIKGWQSDDSLDQENIWPRLKENLEKNKISNRNRF